MSAHLRYTGEPVHAMHNSRTSPALIDSWLVLTYAAEEVCLAGRISGHPRQDRFLSDEQITTPLMELPLHWPLREGDVVRTLNTWYVLGKPKEEASS